MATDLRALLLIIVVTAVVVMACMKNHIEIHGYFERNYYNQDNTSDFANGSFSSMPASSANASKYILWYTGNFKMSMIAPAMKMQDPEGFEAAGCPVTNCYVTNNKKLLPSLEDYDALMFHLWEGNLFDSTGNLLELPDQSKRRHSQRYVIYGMEAPTSKPHWRHLYKLRGITLNEYTLGLFNWTMTQRMDSDIPMKMSWLVPKGQNVTMLPPKSMKPQGGWVKFDKAKVLQDLRKKSKSDAVRSLVNKTNKVAWIVSHCKPRSGRHLYVEELKKYIQVDIFGGCGQPCPNANRWNNDACTDNIYKNYKFYISFENTLCDSYVTEKLWWRLPFPVVPIVMGGSTYSDIVPPRSVINTANFVSPKHLATYLHYLDTHDEAYLTYFWWREHYDQFFRGWAAGMCELCRKLHDDTEPDKVVDDVEEWWYSGRCIDRLLGKDFDEDFGAYR